MHVCRHSARAQEAGARRNSWDEVMGHSAVSRAGAGRLQWVDQVKAIGIILVVTGHSIDPLSAAHWFIYLFHMPLFFIVSGYFIKPNANVAEIVRERFKTLMLPYFSYLLLIGLPVAIFDPENKTRGVVPEFVGYVFGGSHLVYYMTAFWFVTALFFGLIVAQFVVNWRHAGKNLAVVAALVGAGALTLLISDTAIYPPVHGLLHYGLPLSVDFAPVVAIMLLIGTQVRRVIDSGREVPVVLGAIVVLALTAVLWARGVPIEVDYKHRLFGVPVFGIVYTAAASFIAIAAVKHAPLPQFAANALSFVGQRSLTVMFISQPFIIIMQRHGAPVYAIIPIALAIALIAHQIFERNAITRRFFLGRGTSRQPKVA
eukprot:gene12855-12955_t